MAGSSSSSQLAVARGARRGGGATARSHSPRVTRTGGNENEKCKMKNGKWKNGTHSASIRLYVSFSFFIFHSSFFILHSRRLGHRLPPASCRRRVPARRAATPRSARASTGDRR